MRLPRFSAFTFIVLVSSPLALATPGDWQPRDQGVTQDSIRKKEVERIQSKKITTKDEWLSALKKELEKPQVIGEKSYPFAFEALLKLREKIGGDLNAVVDPETEGTLLHLATRAKKNAQTLALALVRAGADVEAKNKQGDTALAIALIADRPQVAKVLLEAGASKDTLVRGKPFKQAVLAQGSLEVFRLLYPDRDSLSAVDPKSGQSILFELTTQKTGAQERTEALVRDALNRGADPAVKNAKGESLFEVATNPVNDSEGIAILLTQHPKAAKSIKASLEIPDGAQRRGIQKLLAQGQYRLATLLVKKRRAGNLNTVAREGDSTTLDDVIDLRAKFSKLLPENLRQLEELKQSLRTTPESLDEKTKSELEVKLRQTENRIAELTESEPRLKVLESEIRRAGGRVAIRMASQDGWVFALRDAAAAGDHAKVLRLLKVGAKFRDGREDALLAAAENGREKVVALLLDRGVNIHAQGDRAFYGAVRSGQIDVIKQLLKRGIKIRKVRDQALLVAAKAREKKAVAFFLDQGANVPTNHEVREIWIAASNEGAEVAQLLLDRGADIHADHDVALRLAAQYNELDTVKLLLDRGADIHASEDWALNRAVQLGHVEMAGLLISRGAGIHSIKDESFESAARQDHAPMLIFLLDRGMDNRALKDSSLIEALLNGSIDTARLLLERGANVHQTCDHPLFRCAKARNEEMVFLLFRHGATPGFKNPPVCRQSVTEQLAKDSAQWLESMYLKYLASAQPLQEIRDAGVPAPASSPAVSEIKVKALNESEATSPALSPQSVEAAPAH